MGKIYAALFVAVWEAGRMFGPSADKTLGRKIAFVRVGSMCGLLRAACFSCSRVHSSAAIRSIAS